MNKATQAKVLYFNIPDSTLSEVAEMVGCTHSYITKVSKREGGWSSIRRRLFNKDLSWIEQISDVTGSTPATILSSASILEDVL